MQIRIRALQSKGVQNPICHRQRAFRICQEEGVERLSPRHSGILANSVNWCAGRPLRGNRRRGLGYCPRRRGRARRDFRSDRGWQRRLRGTCAFEARLRFRRTLYHGRPCGRISFVRDRSAYAEPSTAPSPVARGSLPLLGVQDLRAAPTIHPQMPGLRLPRPEDLASQRRGCRAAE